MNSNSIIKQDNTLSYQLFQFLTNPTSSYSYSILRMCSLNNVIKISSTQQKHTNNELLLQFYKKIGKTTKKLFYEWLSLLIFNVCALNEQHYDQVQKYMLQSTSADVTLSDRNSKITQQALALLKKNMKKWFEQLFNSEIIQKIIEIEDKANYQLSILYETIDYVLIKYHIHMENRSKLISQIQSSLKVKQPNIDMVKALNIMIFSEGIHQFLQANYNINDINIIKLINANYANTTYQRKIFKSAKLTGKQTIQLLIYALIKKKTCDISKLFSKDYEKVNRIYKFIMNWVWNRFAYISVYFYERFISNFTETMDQKMKSINSYLNSLIYQESQFQSILYQLYSALSSKSNHQVALELMKKFILNRFLLNVQHIISNFVDCHDNQALISHILSSANKIRLLFYEEKQQHSYKQMSSRITKSLVRLITNSQMQKGINNNTSAIYIPDKMLYLCYNQLSLQINNDQSLSLSFSLLKNEDTSQNISHNLPVDSNSKRIPHFFQSPRTQLSIIQEKQSSNKHVSKRSYKQQSGHSDISNPPQTSLRVFLKHWQKGQNLTNPELLNEKSKQTEIQTQLTPQIQDQLQTMIENRRQYGVLKQLIFDRSCQRSQKWKIKSMQFKKQINHMRDWRKKLEQSSTQLKLQIELL